MSGNGIVRIPSRFSVEETLNKLQATLETKAITLFALIDHSGEAAKAGLQMPPTKLLIFGNPKGGTPLMLASPSIAIDLPIKMLVAEDEQGKVWISYNTAEYLGDTARPAPKPADQPCVCRSAGGRRRGLTIQQQIPIAGARSRLCRGRYRASPHSHGLSRARPFRSPGSIRAAPERWNTSSAAMTPTSCCGLPSGSRCHGRGRSSFAPPITTPKRPGPSIPHPQESGWIARYALTGYDGPRTQ